jgi:D-hydroxyproline dehydrogenase subunit alpha
MLCDLVVIGAGPAGLAGAAAAAGTGRSVVLLDMAARPGGQFYRHAADGRPAPGQHDWRTFVRLRALCADRGVKLLTGHRVFAVEAGRPHVVHAVTDDGSREVRARAVLLATGAGDRQIPFPGWDLPGVLAAGAAQALVKEHRVVPGRRIVVAGTGPFLLPVAACLATAGAQVVGVFEANSPSRFARFLWLLARNPGRLAEAAGYLATLARHRIPLHTRHSVVAAHGADELAAVTVARADGTEWRIDCDTLAIGYGFTPQIDIGLAFGCATRLDVAGSLVLSVNDRHSTTVPGVFAAGEVTGVGGARLALRTGREAGRASVGVVGRPQLRRPPARHTAFAAALPKVYPMPDWVPGLPGDTVVCRCEEVRLDAIRTAVTTLGARDARAVKLLTRAGMGWCQGRVCGEPVACIVAHLTGVPPDASTLAAMTRRTLTQPIRLGELAHTKEEQA